MPLTRKLYKHKDNVSGQLNAGISAATTTIPLKSGNGANFPTTYNGSATSSGSSVLLNSTGIGSSGISVGDIIENVTDGSVAIVRSVSTNSIVTTRLKGGTNNTWANTDKWHVNRFVVTLIHYDTDGETVLKREKVLIDSRTSDNLTVNASGRGFDGSTAQSFSADDYVYIFWTSAAADGIDQFLGQLAQDVDNLVSQGSGEIYAADGGGSDAYAVTLVPAPSAYTTGMIVNFKANTANTGAASLNVNSLGAKTVKKANDQDLENNDIEAGQIVTVVYDGTNFQMQSQVANVFTSKANVQNGDLIYAADAQANDSYAITLSPAPVAYATGMMLNFKANTANTGAATLNVNSLGAKTIKKNYNQDLATGDILANQIVTVIYDGTNFQLLSRNTNMVYVLSKSSTDVQFLSSTAENNMLSLTVPANTMGGGSSAGGLRGVFKITAGVQTSTATHTFRLKYGGTTLGTLTMKPGAGSESVHIEILFYIQLNGATNAQKSWMKSHASQDNDGTGVLMRITAGTAAIDSTADQTLLLTHQMSENQASCSATLKDYIIEVF